MRDLVQFVRQLWEDRLLSVEDFTREHGLSLEEALKLRNKELEGCMKDLECQTDALLDALEEADSLLASPRKSDEKITRKLALGECLQRLGKQEEEASQHYDNEKVAFLQQARQLLIDSFQGDSPVLSESSLVGKAEEDGEQERQQQPQPEQPPVEYPKINTEEQIMQTEAALGEEVGTQTRKALARKIKALKERTDKLEPKIKSLNRSPSPPKNADATANKPRRKKRRSVSPRYINERLQIRAPSPRRRLPWESPTTEEDADDGYTSLDLLPAVPPQPQNSAASLADPDDDFQGFLTAEENIVNEGKAKKTKSKSKSPKGKRSKASRSPKRQDRTVPEIVGPSSPSGPVPAVVADMGQGEGGRPRRRRSKSQRSQMKLAAADAPGAGSSDEEEGERRRRTAEPHGDGTRPRRRSRGNAEPSEFKPVSPSRSGKNRPSGSRRGTAGPTANQVYCLATLPQPEDPMAGSAAAAATTHSDSKLMCSETEPSGKQRAAQPRPVRRKRCSGGGDTMSVQSFNSTEESRGRPESARQLRTPAAATPPPQSQPAGAVGGEEVPLRSPAAGFSWDTSHLVYQPDPFHTEPASPNASPAAADSPPDMWAYRCHPRESELADYSTLLPPGDGPATDDAKARQAAATDDSGFQSEPAARSLTSFRSQPYVPPLPLQQSPDSAAAAVRSRSDPESSPSPVTSARSPRSPSRSRLLTNSVPLERSTSCEIPHKKQRRADERPSALSLHGCGDQPSPPPPPVIEEPVPAPAAAEPAVAAVDEQLVVILPPPPPLAASAAPPPPPADESPALELPALEPPALESPAMELPALESPALESPSSPVKVSDSGSDYRDCEETLAAPSGDGTANLTAISPSVLVKDYEQLQESLAELKEMQTTFQKDFAANEHAKEMTSNLQSDIQRLESSIQELQGIVSQEYEQTRQDHDETRAAIEVIETRVEASERTTQSQLDQLRTRLEQIAEKMTQLETDVKKDSKALDTDKLAAPNVMTLSSMLNRLETEVITLRHEVDSNRHSIDSITSVTQLDSPKPSPLSAGVVSTSDWPQTTERTDITKSSAPTAADRGGDQQPRANAQNDASDKRPRSRPEDLDSFKDSHSELSVSEGSLLTGPADQGTPAASQQQQQKPPQSAPAHRLRPQLEEQRRPPAVSPLRVGGRRCRGGHQPEVAKQLRQMLLLPPPARATSKRSRSAVPSGSRDESDELREYWGQDLSTASASTEPPLHDESTRGHHGSSRTASRNVDEPQGKTDPTSDVFLTKIDGLPDPSEKLDHLQNKLLELRHRVLLSMYKRQRRRAVSEGPRAQQADQQRRRAQLAAIDRRLRQRIHGWNRRLLADAIKHGSSTGDVVSEGSSSPSGGTSEETGLPAPAAATRRAASEYLNQLSYMLSVGGEQEDGKEPAVARGRHRQRAHSPPTKDPSACQRRSNRRQPAPVDVDGSQMQRFARNEWKLAELQTYLGGIRQHLQKMALDLDSPPSRPRPAPQAQGVVFSPWQHQQQARGRSLSIQRRPLLSMRF